MTDKEKKAWWERLDENTQNSLLKNRNLKPEQYLKLLDEPFFFRIENFNSNKTILNLAPFFELNLRGLSIDGMVLDDSFMLIKKQLFLEQLGIAETEGFRQIFFDAILELKELNFLSFYDVPNLPLIPNLSSMKKLKHLELCEIKVIDLACVRNTKIEVLIISGYEKVLNLDALLTLKSTLRYVNWTGNCAKIPLVERNIIISQLPDVKFIEYIPMSGYI